jgi:hypothetical protein
LDDPWCDQSFVFKDVWVERKRAYAGVQNVLRGKSGVRGFFFDDFVIEEEKGESLDDFEPLTQRNVEGVEFR